MLQSREIDRQLELSAQYMFDPYYIASNKRRDGKKPTNQSFIVNEFDFRQRGDNFDEGMTSTVVSGFSSNLWGGDKLTQTTPASQPSLSDGATFADNKLAFNGSTSFMQGLTPSVSPFTFIVRLTPDTFGINPFPDRVFAGNIDSAGSMLGFISNDLVARSHDSTTNRTLATGFSTGVPVVIAVVKTLTGAVAYVDGVKSPIGEVVFAGDILLELLGKRQSVAFVDHYFDGTIQRVLEYDVVLSDGELLEISRNI